LINLLTAGTVNFAFFSCLHQAQKSICQEAQRQMMMQSAPTLLSSADSLAQLASADALTESSA
jgi:hypothetical protein